MKTELTESMLKDTSRRNFNTILLPHCIEEDPSSNTAYVFDSSYAPINSGWLKYKGDLVKRVGNTYKYV